MGRIKSTPVKVLGDEMMEKNPKKFSEDFEKNKQDLDEVVEIKSKRIRNIVAGYITKKMKKIKRSGI